MTHELERIFRARGSRTRRNGNGFIANALHRPDKNPSLSVFLGSNGVWMAHDFAIGKTWPLWKYLMEHAGLSEDEVIALGLKEPSEDWRKLYYQSSKRDERILAKIRREYEKLAPPVTFAPFPEAEPPAGANELLADALSRLGDERATWYLRERGFTPEQAADLGIGVMEDGSLVFPEYDLPGSPIRNLKVRNAKDENGRFRYLFRGVGNGFFMLGDWERAGTIAIVEGEVNAASFFLAMPNRFVIAMPGASKGLTEALANAISESGKLVELWYDSDEAGRNGLEKVKAQLLHAGVEPVRIIIPLENPIKDTDLNDIMRRNGLARLVLHVRERLGRSKKVARFPRKSGRALARFLGVHDSRTAALRVGYFNHKALRRFHITNPNPRMAAVEAIIRMADKREMVQRAFRALYLRDPAFAAALNIVASAVMNKKVRAYDLQKAMALLGAARLAPGHYHFHELAFLSVVNGRAVVDFDGLFAWMKSYAGVSDYDAGGTDNWYTWFLGRLAKAKAQFTQDLVRFFRFLGRTFNGHPVPAVT